MTLYIGIDPGMTGAACCIDIDCKTVKLFPFRAKKDFINLKDFSCYLYDYADTRFVEIYLEQVHAMPGQGGGSMFSFGLATGYVKGVLTGFALDWKEVTPQCWQKELGLSTPYPTKYQRKQAHLRLAKKLYPNFDIKLEEADAVLIAEYGRRINNVA